MEVRNEEYIVACGVVWQREFDREAGEELTRALADTDLQLRLLAGELLLCGGDRSLQLLEVAIQDGTLTPMDAAPCMAALVARRLGCYPAPFPEPSSESTASGTC